MDMKKEIYFVNVEKSTDDGDHYSPIFKLCKLGKYDNAKYIWICINYNGGIGTRTPIEVWDETIEDSFITLHKISGSEGYSSFERSLDDALLKRLEFLNRIKKETVEDI